MSVSGAKAAVLPSPVHVAARGVCFDFHPQCGIVSGFAVRDQGRQISMMHAAPWVGSGITLAQDAPPHQAQLQGDFFCAPFSDASADNAPLHGWPANGLWQVSGEAGINQLTCALTQTVMGATVRKHLSLIDDHPFLYQCHSFTGGQGAMSAANHAMISLPNGGILRFSRKRRFETPADAPETDPSRGRSALRYPASSADPASFPAKEGGIVDLTSYPYGPAHEDFVIAVEDENSRLGWTAVTRPVEGDLYLSLRHPRKLPMTMLWHSNGGRDYAPWNGRHRGCLGVEDGIAWPLLQASGPYAGQSASVDLAPDGVTDVRHVTGCIHWPTGEAVRDVQLAGDCLIVVGDHGATRTLPIDGAFLDL